MSPKDLSSRSANPLYKQLIQRLRTDIQSGVYPVHSRFPSELSLCDAYGVSRVTVRKALSVLTQEGLLERHQGVGTFVCTPRIHKDLRSVNSFSEACRLMGAEPSTDVISAQLLPADGEDQTSLLLAPDEQVVELVRLRRMDGVPVMLETNRFPSHYAWLLQEDLTGSLYSLLHDRNVDPGQATHEVSLCYAAPREAHLLDVAPESALLSLFEVIYDLSGHPLHTSHQRIRGDRFAFRI